MKIKELANMICHLNDKVIVEILEELEHVDDILIVTFLRSYFIVRIHQNCLKLKKGRFFYKRLYNIYKSCFKEDIQKSFHIKDKKLLNTVSEYFDSAYKLIEQIYDSSGYHDFFEFENICNGILKEMLNVVNVKNNTDFSMDMRKYELCISENFILVEKVLVDFQ